MGGKKVVESGGNLFKMGDISTDPNNTSNIAITFVVVGTIPQASLQATPEPRSRFTVKFHETAINWNLILDVDFFFLSACKGGNNSMTK